MQSPKNLFVLPHPSHPAQQNIPSDQTPGLKNCDTDWIKRCEFEGASVFYYLEITTEKKEICQMLSNVKR